MARIIKLLKVAVVVGLCVLIHLVLKPALQKSASGSVSKTTQKEAPQSASKAQAQPNTFQPTHDHCKERGPVKNILYLKIYKTGSSTLQNIFYRYAWNKNLTIVPVYSDPHLHELTDHLVPPAYRKKGRYNIFPEHIKRFQKSDYSAYMHNDTVYVSSLRYPFKQFVSMLKEYDYMPKKLGLKSREPVEVVKEILSSEKKKLLDPLLGRPDFLYNQMAMQFNLINEDGTEKDNIDSIINNADDIFSLVMLTEHFDESLVLLRRRLCWDQKDIIYVHLRHKPDIADHTNFKDYLSEHKKRSAADYKLYKHFKTKMLATIATQGKDFHQELTNFKQRIRRVSIFCSNVYNAYETDVMIIYDKKRKLKLEGNQWTPAFVIYPYDCLIMKLENHVFRNMLLFRQMPINICKQNLSNQPPIAHNLDLKSGKLYCNKYYCHKNKQKRFQELFAGTLRKETLSL